MKISVVIPMYNAEKTIVNALDSVVKQTFEQQLEIIVVNDGAKDNSVVIVSDYIKTNSSNRKILLINRENGGVSSARNAGIKNAAGVWIAFLDSDDIWLSEKLEKQLQAINENKSIKFIGTNRNDEHYPFFGKAKPRIFTLNAKEVMLKWYPHTSTALIHRSVFDQAGYYDEKRTHAEDGDLFVRMAQFCDLYVLNENLVYTGGGKRSFGESGLSANLPKMYEGELHIVNQAFKRRQINRLHLLFFYFWLSMKYFRRKLITRWAK